MKLLKSAVFLATISTSCLAISAPTEEVLLGIDILPNSLEIHVKSGGCTSSDSFEVDVNKGVTGNPPYMVTIKRIKADNCKMLVLDGVKVNFDRKMLGLDGLVEFSITNTIGNTSNHR